MKNWKKSFLGALVGLALVPTVIIAAGIDQKFPGSDLLKFGVSSSSDSKTIEFDTGDSGSNLKLTVDDARALGINTNDLTLGEGDAANKLITFDRGGSNPFIRWNESAGFLQFSNDGTAIKNIGSGAGGGGGINLAVDSNPDCESGDPPSSYTASGGTFAAETTSELFGTQSCNWDSSGSAQTLDTPDFTLPIGLYGNQCMAKIRYSYEVGSSGDYQLQLIDGSDNILSSGNIDPTTGNSREAFVIATCPSSGSVALRLESQVADADPIIFEEVHVGSNIKEISVASAELFGTLTYPNNSGCAWSSTSGTYADFAADGDCSVAPVVTGRVSAPDTLIPGFKVSTLPPGRYEITTQGVFNASSGSALSDCAFRLHDGTSDLEGRVVMIRDTTVSRGLQSSLTSTYINTSTKTDVTFRMQSVRAIGDATCQVLNVDSTKDDQLNFVIKRFPLDSEKSVLLSEANGWYIDASVGGGNINMSTNGTASTYEAVQSNASLSVVLGSGSAAAQAVCTSGEAPSGLTCSSNSERLGLAFDIPFAGAYEVCGTFAWSANTTTAVQETFQWHETGLSDDTSIQAAIGNAYVRTGTNAGTTITSTPVRVCGVFTFNSVGKKSIKLFHEYSVNATATSNDITIDRSAGAGQRDATITVRPVTQNFPMPLILDTVVSPGAAGMVKTYGAHIQLTGGTPTVIRQIGDWITSVDDDGTGNFTLNFKAGAFANADSESPVCSCTALDNASDKACQIDSDTACDESTCQFTYYIANTATATDDGTASIMCMGI